MKEFKTWLQKFYSIHQGDKHFNPDSVHGWRAALEWVLRTVKELDEQDAPIDVGDVIRQELKDD